MAKAAKRVIKGSLGTKGNKMMRRNKERTSQAPRPTTPTSTPAKKGISVTFEETRRLQDIARVKAYLYGFTGGPVIG